MSQVAQYENCFETLAEARSEIARLRAHHSAQLQQLGERVKELELELGALHGRIGLFANEHCGLSDNLPTDETFKRMGEYIIYCKGRVTRVEREINDLIEERDSGRDPEIERLHASLNASQQRERLIGETLWELANAASQLADFAESSKQTLPAENVKQQAAVALSRNLISRSMGLLRPAQEQATKQP